MQTLSKTFSMELTKKDISEARRLSNRLATGNIPVKEIRDFLERIGRDKAAPSKPGKKEKRRMLVNEFKSQFN